MKFLIIVTGYNCYQYVPSCYLSILNQTYTNWEAVFISDGSTDRTANLLSFPDKRVKSIISKENRGAAYQRMKAIQKYSDGELVVLLLGMDDELLPNALSRIKKEYDKGCLMTYGSWKNQYGRPLKMDITFSRATHYNRSYRQDVYRSTAPNTFKKKLFDLIPESDFKYKNKWIATCTEVEVMFSCLEMSGEHRIGVIKEPIYMYREGLPNGTVRKHGRAKKIEVLNYIKSRPKKQIYEDMRNNSILLQGDSGTVEAAIVSGQFHQQPETSIGQPV